uniref:2'-phosphotransferase n=2 Tax=Amphimedon queenslandica TaxID=400682 RepID=A0A1X7VGV5_AMPQE
MASPGERAGEPSDRGRPVNDVQLSKFLSYICRHGAEKKGLTVQEGGYINVDDILELREARKNGYSVSDVQRVVANYPKQRFSLRSKPNDDGKLQICANQGHSLEVKGLDLVPILRPEEAPVVVHGTYRRAWEQIKKQGLSKMSRNHVHFAAGLPGEDGVISGMRSSCQILIYIDMKKALEGGLLFYRSANNVILCSGDENGFISTKYFEKVYDITKGVKLDYY